jgi:hypothetical protein
VVLRIVEADGQKVRGSGPEKLSYLGLERYGAAGSTVLEMNCGPDSGCCDELRPAKKKTAGGSAGLIWTVHTAAQLGQ